MARKIKHHGSNSLNGILFSPESVWTPPHSFPNLSGVNRIGIDTETRDPDLNSRGPGFIRGNAEVIGVSIATHDAKWYFPMGHLGGGNLDRGVVTRFVKDVICNCGIDEIVGANLQYELEGLWSMGITVPESTKLLDIQIAEPLLDEERDANYALDTLCKIHLGTGKDESLLRDAASAYGVDPKKDLWKLPSKYVGAYAEYDAFSSLQIFERQVKELEKQDLTKIFELETELLPLLWRMRQQGIPVDLEKAHKLSKELGTREDALRLRMKREFSREVDVWSGPELAGMCTDLKIMFPRTTKGNPSFVSDWLDDHDHPFIKLVSEIREINRLKGTFVDKWIFGNQIKGRIHPQWKQLMSDEGGTRTGRMAAANPNPQQVPSRSDLAPLIRAIFSHDKWWKGDYSQQEPRLLVHYAYIAGFTGAALIRDAYRNNRNMDFYQFLVDASNLTRRDSKDATLGRMYNMGVDKYCHKYNKTEEQARGILKTFDETVPFVKELGDSVMLNAQRRGWIRTIGGRKRHFNYWEPFDAFKRKRERNEAIVPQSRENAEDLWPGVKLQRAHTHKGLNSLIQGSAADMTKMAMCQMYRIHKTVPFMAVHDEIDAPTTGKEHGDKLTYIMENAVDMTVPLKVDASVGEHWK